MAGGGEMSFSKAQEGSSTSCALSQGSPGPGGDSPDALTPHAIAWEGLSAYSSINPMLDGGEKSGYRTEGLTQPFTMKLSLTLPSPACKGLACPLNIPSATLVFSPLSGLYLQMSITPLLKS